jgi:hypothetical protein
LPKPAVVKPRVLSDCKCSPSNEWTLRSFENGGTQEVVSTLTKSLPAIIKAPPSFGVDVLNDEIHGSFETHPVGDAATLVS